MQKIGIISGSGILPNLVGKEARAQNIEPYFVFLKGSADETIENVKNKKLQEKYQIQNINHVWASITKVGQILAYLRENDIKTVMFAGGMQRPPLLSLIPDMTGAKLLKQLLNIRKAGDDAILKEIIKFLEEEKFRVIGVTDIAPALLTPKGTITKTRPNERQFYDIQYGFEVASTIGKLDVGQAVIVQDGEILGVEAAEGTAELIKRCAKLQRGGKGAILVKACKPTQDKRVDLPSIGANTIESLDKLGFNGVALTAGESILLDKEEIAYQADRCKIFVQGV